MTTNAEKLARELIALSERFSARDFDRASELLLSGKLFERTISTAKVVLNANKTAARKPDRFTNSRPSASPHRAKRVLGSQKPELNLQDLLSDFTENEREEIASFADRFERREILGSGPAVRVFATQLNTQFPKSLPSRTTILKTLLQRLRDLPKETRLGIVEQAERISSGESSLQRWSDLIVKRDEG